MNISTKCNCCVKEDVCKYKHEYESAVRAILCASYCVGSSGLKVVKDSDVVEVSIKCKKMLTASAVKEV